MSQERDNPFAFLGGANPGSLYRLVEKLPLEDAAMVLANLKPVSTAQVMAYFSDDKQGDLLAAMRVARRAGPEEAEKTVAKLRGMAAEARNAPPPASAPGSAQRQSPADSSRTSVNQGMPASGKTIASAYGKAPAAGQAKPQPWKPRVTDETPINAPARPNRPPPVAGDPHKSPLGKLNLLEMLGLGKRDDAKSDAPAAGVPPARPSGSGQKPAAREGVLSNPNLRTAKTPRVLGIGKPVPSAGAKKTLPPAPKTPAPPAAKGGDGGGRKMDGMAIMAAILRNASVDVRQNVASDNPALFKALKDRMFVFDDLIYSEDEALAQIFTVAPLSDAALALRFAPPVLRDRAMRAVSPGRAAMLKDSAVSGGNARAGLDAIEQAQQRVLEVALRLQSAGRLIIDPDDPDLAL